ncbi:uncharacterized protein [Coffea arabica]|uniref:Uncharacterized protein isoform X4 n=1 Tax=Coffea arabica TaxID=13443 RepID=A0A6P6VT27_COFAR|nr:transcription factor bHLH63-like isoform X4 [Coffea arabica]XP_027105747.1 transcription factor bHLH63-like isoform X4 [Coffea arabica]XP_027112244.1 transcription factor bHLH63-like isoform X4 [Coffea arabica]XP_027112245.1 transcription factor bHLH63-like isoform X4 [Coffea arabica]
MLDPLNTPANFNRDGGFDRMSVLERQEAIWMKWQEEQLHHPPPLPLQVRQLGHDFFNSTDQLNVFSSPAQAHQHFHGFITNDHHFSGLLTPGILKQDPDVQTTTGCDNFTNIGGPSAGVGACELENITGFGMDYAVSRTVSCPPAMAAAMADVAAAASKGRETTLPEKLSSSAGRESFKKRKADKTQNQKEATEQEGKDKRSRGCQKEEDSKVTEQKSTSKNTATNNTINREASETSKENSKISEVQKPDYIHVRARRGQATDSHSLAERVRREKISERMKYLQDLVPGCNKITGKAGMLDEIINYVQSLQRQVEFLSMKLAAINPRLDFNIDNISTKEQVVSCCGLETGADPSEMALRRTISAPVSIHETLRESPYFSQIHPSTTWDAELQSLYALEFQQGKSTSLLSQPCTGYLGGSNVKMEI